MDENSLAWIPDSIVSMICIFHGIYDINFESDIIDNNEYKIEFMEMISMQLKKQIKISRVYSGVNDGFKSNIFHNKCDNISPTITLIINDYDTIFGGYTTIPWSNNIEFHSDNSAFLFQFKPNSQVFSLKIPNEKHAIFHSRSKYLIAFGRYDLEIFRDCHLSSNNRCKPFNYSFNNPIQLVGHSSNNINITNNQSIQFRVKNMELFKLI